MSHSVVVFDGDDTLWCTEPLYDRVRSEVGEVIREAGMDPEEWSRIQREVDVANVARLGLTRRRFPTSCVQAYELMAGAKGVPVLRSTQTQIHELAATVFTARAPVIAEADAVLSQLAEHSALALLTRGDRAVQERRIKESGLSQMFKRIEIVPEKSSTHFMSMLRALGGNVSHSWSIGNSWRSDIAPALAAGLGAVWIDAHVWEYEKSEAGQPSERLRVALSLAEVPGILSTDHAWKSSQNRRLQ